MRTIEMVFEAGDPKQARNGYWTPRDGVDVVHINHLCGDDDGAWGSISLHGPTLDEFGKKHGIQFIMRCGDEIITKGSS